MIRMRNIINALLGSVPVMGFLPVLFEGVPGKIPISPFTDAILRTRFWTVYFYVEAYTYLVLLICLLYPKGVNVYLKRFVLSLVIVDILHLFFMAGKGYGYAKWVPAMLMVWLHDLYIKRYGS